jgi:hypothetical protein
MLRHEIYFHQKRDGKERTVALILEEEFRLFSHSEAYGGWRHGPILNYTGADVHLYRHAPPGETKFHYWTWNSNTFTIEVGKVNKRASHKDGENEYFRKWISLFNAKRSADWKFSISSPYADGTGSAQFELPTSSDTFDQSKPAYWQILTYSR